MMASEFSMEDMGPQTNLLHLREEDFPDVCIECQHCVSSLRQAIEGHTASQIRDPEMAAVFVDEAMAELLKFLEMREERCQEEKEHEHAEGESHHRHHSHNEHAKLEEGL